MYLRGTMEQGLSYCFDGIVSLLYSILALFRTTSPRINYLISKKENMYFILVQPSEKEIQYKYLKSQEIQYKYLKSQENVFIKQIHGPNLARTTLLIRKKMCILFWSNFWEKKFNINVQNLRENVCIKQITSKFGKNSFLIFA